MTQPLKPEQSVYHGLNGAPQYENAPSSSSPALSISLSDNGPETQQSVYNRSSSNSQISTTVTPTLAPTPASQSRSSSRGPASDGTTNVPGGVGGKPKSYRQLVYQSFAPRVAVFASPDTEEFVRRKGFEGGLCSLLRPFGENVPGRVVIRDSFGGSKSWDGYGVRFVRSDSLQPTVSTTAASWDFQARNATSQYLSNPRTSSDPSLTIEASMKSYLPNETSVLEDHANDQQAQSSEQLTYYGHYLRLILSSSPLVPYESFSHPVACLITVSSHSPAPIDTLRHLYAQSNSGSNKIPGWMSTEYLRYYVLIHDEENDDITTSTALFDLMKRHFGLHCHLLRLKSSPCTRGNEEGAKAPSVRWLSADEEVAGERMKDYTEESAGTDQFIADSDTVAINSFIREMVVQSVIPFMENRVVTWNDQVASRRRGISGRFMSLSKRFAGFGSTKSSTSSPGSNVASGSNFNVQEGFYPPGSPEATMRQLADFAFMLRDWKLAYTTYDLLRSDFGQDKAWHYHAAVNEMAATTSLLNLQNPGMRYRADLIDQLLETASYSYLTRCSSAWGVIRCLTIAIELLRDQGPHCADDIRKWGCKLLESDVLRPMGQALTAERVADSYCSRLSTASRSLSSRRRQAALWHLLSAGSWTKVARFQLAQYRLQNTTSLHKAREDDDESLPFPSMQVLWGQLLKAAKAAEDVESSMTLIDATDLEQTQGTFEVGNPGRNRRSSTFARPAGNIGDVDDEGFTSQGAGRLTYEPSDIGTISD